MPCPPAKMTSCIDCPRTASGLCSPSAQSTASVMFDLPEPLGPTTTDTPGAKSSRVRSGKDLKPFRVTDLRCMRAPRSGLLGGLGLHGLQRVQGLQRDPRGLLLGVLLGAPGAPADRRPADARDDLERT